MWELPPLFINLSTVVRVSCWKLPSSANRRVLRVFSQFHMLDFLHSSRFHINESLLLNPKSLINSNLLLLHFYWVNWPLWLDFFFFFLYATCEWQNKQSSPSHIYCTNRNKPLNMKQEGQVAYSKQTCRALGFSQLLCIWDV